MPPEADADDPFRSGCPIASALDIIGDRWTLVILRDLVNGKKRFGDFLAGPERIATNVLAARLLRMERDGLIESTPYQARPARHEYRLTPRGAGLLPVLQALCRWGGHYLPDRWTPPESFMSARVADVLSRP